VDSKDYVTRKILLETRRLELQEEIKDLKQQAKDAGVENIPILDKAIAKLVREHKEKQKEDYEEVKSNFESFVNDKEVIKTLEGVFG
jgi:F0F1-type ATP synthase membrane subunit b/b'